MSKPFAWSWSVLTSFEACPRRHYLTRVAKVVKEPEGEALRWGNQVHKALELRIGGNKPLPSNMVQYEKFAASILNRRGKIEVEHKLAINASFEPTAWFAPDVWARGITDVTVEKGDRLFIGDWKTGKPSPESAQLRMTAAMMMHHRPHINTVVNAFLWLQGGAPTVERLTRDDIPQVWRDLMPRVERLEHALASNKFPPKPSGLCKKFCPVGKQNCEHCGS